MVVQLVESMKKLFLGALFVTQQLDVIDQQHVRRPGTGGETAAYAASRMQVIISFMKRSLDV